MQQVVNLALRRPHLDLRVDQAGGPDDLLDGLLAHLRLPRPGRGRDVDRLVEVRLELVEAQRPVVDRRRQAEAEVDERLLARDVAVVHAAHLRDRLVRLVDEQQEVVREVVHQRPGNAPGLAAGEVAGVVLDAGAVALLAQALDIVACALDEALGLEQLVLVEEPLVALSELSLDVDDRSVHLVLRGHEVLGGIDIDGVHLGEHLAGQRVELEDALHLVAEEVDAHGQLLVGGQDREAIAAQAEAAADEVLVVALVLHVDEAAQRALAVARLADFELEDEVVVLAGLAEAVDAGDGGDDDHVAALEEGAGGGVAQLVDLVVDVGVLGDVGVGARDVGLRLIVVVVRHEVLDGVLREELAEL